MQYKVNHVSRSYFLQSWKVFTDVKEPVYKICFLSDALLPSFNCQIL